MLMILCQVCEQVSELLYLEQKWPFYHDHIVCTFLYIFLFYLFWTCVLLTLIRHEGQVPNPFRLFTGMYCIMIHACKQTEKVSTCPSYQIILIKMRGWCNGICLCRSTQCAVQNQDFDRLNAHYIEIQQLLARIWVCLLSVL